MLLLSYVHMLPMGASLPTVESKPGGCQQATHRVMQAVDVVAGERPPRARCFFPSMSSVHVHNCHGCSCRGQGPALAHVYPLLSVSASHLGGPPSLPPGVGV
jgi:hypothetical protein